MFPNSSYVRFVLGRLLTIKMISLQFLAYFSKISYQATSQRVLCVFCYVCLAVVDDSMKWSYTYMCDHFIILIYLYYFLTEWMKYYLFHSFFVSVPNFPFIRSNYICDANKFSFLNNSVCNNCLNLCSGVILLLFLLLWLI